MKTIRNICYGALQHEAQQLDLYLPEGSDFPVFVFFHGGGITTGDKSDAVFAEYLASHGIALASANYRMYPKAKYPEFLCDAAEAVSWVYHNIASYGGNGRVYVGGSSAGAYFSMMLCFDRRYLEAHGIAPLDLAGFLHNAGQPTSHSNVLAERGLDSKRVIVDETAPLYYIGLDPAYPPMLFVIADHDVESRYEQNMLCLSTLRHFGYDQDKIALRVLHGTHCQQDFADNARGENILGTLIREFVEHCGR